MYDIRKTNKIKFTIEVNDTFIYDNCDPDKLSDKFIGAKDSAGAMLSSLLNCLAFASIKNEIESGTTEFTVSQDDMDNDNKRQLFESAIRTISILCKAEDK